MFLTGLNFADLEEGAERWTFKRPISGRSNVDYVVIEEIVTESWTFRRPGSGCLNPGRRLMKKKEYREHGV